MKNKLKITYNAPVTLSFVILCFIVTILGFLTNDKSTIMLFSVYKSSFLDPLAYVRILGHVLGHIGFEHFINNAVFLLLLGPLLEEKYGSYTLIKIIVITAMVTGIIHCLFWGNTSLCGASGVVYAFIILSSFTAFKKGEIPLSFILISVFFIGKEIINGITISDNISNLTHVIGGFIGAFLGYKLNKKVV